MNKDKIHPLMILCELCEIVDIARSGSLVGLVATKSHAYYMLVGAG